MKIPYPMILSFYIYIFLHKRAYSTPSQKLLDVYLFHLANLPPYFLKVIFKKSYIILHFISQDKKIPKILFLTLVHRTNLISCSFYIVPTGDPKLKEAVYKS